MSSQKFSCQMMVESECSEEYKRYSYEALRKQVSNKLYDLLWQTKSPCVVDITETIIENSISFGEPYRYHGYDQLRIDVELFAVNHQNITMSHVESINMKDWREKPATMMEKLKFVLGVK